MPTEIEAVVTALYAIERAILEHAVHTEDVKRQLDSISVALSEIAEQLTQREQIK